MKGAPIHDKFTELQRKNLEDLRKNPIDLSELVSFHESEMSIIREVLNYARCDEQTVLQMTTVPAKADE